MSHCDAVRSDDFWDLFFSMIEYEPSERITINEVLEHPWMTKDTANLLDISTYFHKNFMEIETN